MTLQNLKQELLNKCLSKHFFVFRYVENKFLVTQYINDISKILNLEKYYVEDLHECLPNDLFGDNKEYLYIYDVGKLNLELLDNDTFQSILDNNINLIITCYKIDNECDPVGTEFNNLDTLDAVVEFPKLLEWQILDYLSQQCKLDETKLKWLYDVCKGDIYRLDNEIQKLSIFESFEQDNLFNLMNKEGGYADLSSYDIFNLTNALLKRDYNSVRNVLHEIEYIDVEPIGLVTIMVRNLRNVIDIQLDSKATPEKLGMQPRQFNAIRFNCGKYNTSQLINIYKFLLDVDYNLKSGNLIFTDKQFIDYLVCNILNGGLK